MFKWKCHEFGDAIQIKGDKIFTCYCISYQDIKRVYKTAFREGLKEGKNV